MKGRSIEMFDKPRKPRQWLMHVADACESEDKPLCMMACARCGTESEWLEFDTVTEAKRGIRCPKCNA